MNFQVYKAQIDPSIFSDLEVNFIGLVDKPAIEKNFQAFNQDKKRVRFILDEEKRIISGPAMIADMPLYRNDEKMGEYYVYFDKDSIRTIVEKFSAKGFMQKFNLFHDDQQQVSDVTIFNSFISDASLGVKPLAGFEDVNDGSWFISAKVNNDAVWQKVKEGLIKGFSVEGLFTYIPIKQQKMAAKLTPDDISFLSDAISDARCILRTSILVPKDSDLYSLAQSMIRKANADIDEFKQLLGDAPIDSMYQKSPEKSLKLIEHILNETITD